MTTAELQAEALARATGNTSALNYGAIYSGFLAKGIAEEDIIPRVNVLTFHAWKAKGRSVRKGEHGVRVVTWIPFEKRERQPDGTEKIVGGKRCKGAVVFHVSQTEVR